jgi:hypothetical protein
MPLIALFSSNPLAIDELTIEQIVATAGDGSLKPRSFVDIWPRFLPRSELTEPAENFVRRLATRLTLPHQAP